jgi:hypothetical protein
LIARPLLRLSVRGLDLKVEQDGIAVLHQRVRRIAQPGFFTQAFSSSLGLGVGAD